MTRFNEIIHKQGHDLLQNERNALMCIAILALIPFASWLSVAMIALITLRKGWHHGLTALVIGMLSMLIPIVFMTSISTEKVLSVMMVFLPCFVMANLLRVTASWPFTVGFSVFSGVIGIILVHYFVPELINQNYNLVMATLRRLQHEGIFPELLNNQVTYNQVSMANYVFGIQAVSILISALASLMIARQVQAILFYPGGYRQEMLTFRANSWGVLALCIVTMGVYQQNALAISCLPILVVYYLFAGISLCCTFLMKGKGVGALFILLCPLILLPFITLPIYVILGALDGLFNFRSRLLLKAS